MTFWSVAGFIHPPLLCSMLSNFSPCHRVV